MPLIARAKQLLGDNPYEVIFQATLAAILKDIREDLTEFGVTFDNWFSERAFTRTNHVLDMISKLKAEQLTYEKEGALWFRSTQLGDDKDRVLLRANGQATYFMNDLAYHVNKFTRGFDSAIDIFGSDHHGYIPRMKAGLQAFAIASDRLTYLLLQFVMYISRRCAGFHVNARSGSFVTLRELREEVAMMQHAFFM